MTTLSKVATMTQSDEQQSGDSDEESDEGADQVLKAKLLG